MPSPQALKFLTLIRGALPGSGDVDAAALVVRSSLENVLPPDASAWADLEEATQLLRQEFRITILRRNSILRERAEWYKGPLPGDHHWPALKTYLTGPKGWDGAAVDAIDEASNEVVSLLENPTQQTFSSRGLVVGYVQSGKTANMAAVISKAVDRGYSLILVLAGLTDKLRQQTQRRMEADIVNRHSNLWQKLTTTNIKGEFHTPAQGHLIGMKERAQIAVMKKNVAPLQRLLDVIEKTPASDMRRLKVLLIDDECDQATVNSASREMDMSAINEKIRLILKALPSVSYVGYTATPFANVLINPYADQSGTLDDLYPRDFITALPLPDSYFGTQKLFGRTPADPADPQPDEEGLDVIREVTSKDEAKLQAPNQKAQTGFVVQMTPSLQEAILYFIASCAARRSRGQAQEHMTMLVHTSSAIIMHEKVAATIEEWLTANSKSLIAGDGPMWAELEKTWNTERVRAPVTATPETFAQISGFVADVIQALHVPVENGASDDRIDYTASPMTYIVVGGSILARGLTLEGLCVSYFLRTSSQYDTLLQMGRWFGYRHGYEDLPRLWMPEIMRVRFQSLAAIEAEIREDIGNYSRRPTVTPMDFAVRIRNIPGMAIVARSKMRHARRSSIGYWGRHLQTIRFARKDRALLEANWNAASQLINAAQAEGIKDETRLIFRDVPRTAVIRFFREYTIHHTHQDLDKGLLLQFLEQDHPALLKWNVGIVTTDSGTSEMDLGSLGKVHMVRRSRLRGVDDLADIKALMSRADISLDTSAAPSDGDWEELKKARRDELGERPLLLLYPIDRTSSARCGSASRVALDAAADILGVGLVIPLSKDHGGDFVSVELAPPSPEELEAMEQEDMDAMVAAGLEELVSV
ncbi:Z1 domain-containing protein [Bosea sp. PAMC 26642]|uniref:Z1 domain-containing protein n=1 Tax=Bosea sp. (strain PAMC 26642) TaxID=1792307 RepID=UPI00077047B4|nr:Z1 domain-containing protein [Bosea sp. PAMC 26642]AMJ59017.1 beta-1,4-mannanase [Bosea sp. PAMC 26642]